MNTVQTHREMRKLNQRMKKLNAMAVGRAMTQSESDEFYAAANRLVELNRELAKTATKVGSA